MFFRPITPQSKILTSITPSLEILVHLETCDECLRHLPKENPQEVINRLLTDDLPPKDQPKSSK